MLHREDNMTGIKADGVWWGKDCIYVQQIRLVREEVRFGLIVVLEIARLRTKLIEKERQIQEMLREKTR